MRLRILIACEFSGTVRDAFLRLGYDAMSCDLLPGESDMGPHYQGDCLRLIRNGWDAMVCHPPCTYLNSAGLHWIARGRIEADGRPRLAHHLEALEFVRCLLGAPIPMIALENPTGAIGTKIRPASQFIQPHNFGDNASKNTGLWLKGLPLLIPTQRIAGRMVMWKGKQVERWANQTDSGQNVLPPSKDRWKIRSETYLGIADAMARQWGPVIEETVHLSSPRTVHLSSPRTVHSFPSTSPTTFTTRNKIAL